MRDATAYSDLLATQLTTKAFRLSIEDQQFGLRIWVWVVAEAYRYLRRGQAELASGIGRCSELLLEAWWKAAWKAEKAMLSGCGRRGTGWGRKGPRVGDSMMERVPAMTVVGQ